MTRANLRLPTWTTKVPAGSFSPRSETTAPSTSEALRLVDGGGVRIDGGVVSDRALKLAPGTFVVQVGKRKFARVTLR